jgi:two-component system sensor histidine kinase KdpD
LDLSRLESGALQMNRDWYAIGEAIHEAIRRMSRVLSDHPTTVDVPADLPPVCIDYPLIQQVLINLFGNIAKHTPPGTPVRVSARRAGGSLVVSVADEGPGIAASERRAVFQRFYRLEAAEGKRAGAGLGLAICRGFVEAHGGTIWIEDSAGLGTTVTFSLPLGEEEERRGEEGDPGRG